MRNKKYSLKNSLNMLKEYALSSTTSLSDSLIYIDEFLNKSIEGLEEVNFKIENNSKYNRLDFKETLLLCFLLEDMRSVKETSLDESFKPNMSIKKEFNFLFEKTGSQEFTIENFSNFLRSLAYDIIAKKKKKDLQFASLEHGWGSKKLIFTCDYFQMSRDSSETNTVKIKISQNFENIVRESTFIKRFAGFYFEDILLNKYSESQEFSESAVKQKIAYIVTLLLGYKREYKSMLFSSLFKKMTGSNFQHAEYSSLIKEHSSKVSGLPEKSALARIIFQEDDVKMIDANSIQHNCGFDFLLVGPNNKASIVDLKTHHTSSTANFSQSKISTSSMHFLNSILKVISRSEGYSNLKFNSIGLFKISFEISGRIINIDKFEIRTDTVDGFKNNLNVSTKSSLSLSEDAEIVDVNEQRSISNQTYTSIDVRNAYSKIFKQFAANIGKFFTFDSATKNIIIPSEPIVLNSKIEKEDFIEAVKTIVSSSFIPEYKETHIFKDENKIKIIEKFVIEGTKNIDYKATIHMRRYFYNSTLVVTILNNLSLSNKRNPRFRSILTLANDIKVVANAGRNATLNKPESLRFRSELNDLLSDIESKL